jgi:hypothetical protein
MTFDDVFSLYILLQTPHKSIANQQEKSQMERHSATDKSKGYNTLKGTPACDPKYTGSEEPMLHIRCNVKIMMLTFVASLVMRVCSVIYLCQYNLICLYVLCTDVRYLLLMCNAS